VAINTIRGSISPPKDKGQVMTYTEPELKTNEYGVRYYPTAIETDSVGLHFFLDEHYELLCAPSYKDGGYDESNLDHVGSLDHANQKLTLQVNLDFKMELYGVEEDIALEKKIETLKESLRVKNNISEEDYYGLPF
jgi:hypothetical protein